MKNFRIYQKGIAIIMTSAIGITIFTGGLSSTPYIPSNKLQIQSEETNNKKIKKKTKK